MTTIFYSKHIRSLVKTISMLLLICLSANAFAQVNIKVTVTSVSSTLADCDAGFFGIGDSGSDPNYSWTGSSITNRCYEFECNNNANCSASGTQSISEVLYDQSFSCPNGIPANLSWGFRGRENDTPISCLPQPAGGSGSLSSVIIDATHSCPLGGTLGTFTYSFTEATTSGCAGTMSYTVSVVVTGSFPPAVPDLICNAQQLTVGAGYQNYAWCGSYTTPPPPYSYETGEFDMTTPGWLGDAHGSGWFYFVAPASGSVAIETGTQATSIGTAFIVYHAADGAGCGVGHGTSPSGVVLKRKFQYLSSYDDADDDIPLINPQASADIDMNDCGIFNFADGHDLVGGETYYIQMTTDANNVNGNIAIRIRDLGGNGSNPSDIPCQSPSAGLLTTSNWSTSLSHDCSTNYEFTGNSGTSAYTYLDPTGGTNNINESNWVQFTAPNSGAARVEANVPVLGENVALYAFDARFAPGRPNDYSCANLTQTQYAASTAAIFGGSASIFSAYCLEPGYNYFAMADPTQIALSGSTNFLIRDPTSAAPANDILCLTLPNPAYNVPVQLLGASPIAAINGDNTNACIERLAGEPGFQNAADKTVWHYFTAPPSGVANITVTAGTIGTVALAIFPALNGTGCYGGLAPATFTQNGTPTTPRLTPLNSASGGGNVTVQVCCLTPGAKYLIEIDGASTVSEGTYSIKAQEVEVRGGLTSYIDTDGDIYTATAPLPALICSGETVTASSNANILPNGGCLSEGFILHNQATPTQPYSNLTIYQQATPGNQFFVNNGTAPYNTTLYVSALADNESTWGARCPSSRIQDAAPVVFLQPVVFQTPTVSACGNVSIRVSGGLPAYNASNFTYTISPSGNLTTVASGTVGNNGIINFSASVAGNYTIFVNDGEDCQRAKTINVPSVSIVSTNITGANNICAGANTTLTASASGGTNYSYNWTLPDNTTFAGVSLSANQAGTYTVTTTNALGCTATATRNLNLFAAIAQPNIVQTNPLCNIGNGLLNAGNGYTNYVWNTTAITQTITVTTPATYTVTVTNSDGCTATDEFIVTTNTNPNAPTIAASATSICDNGFITLNAANANFVSYNWSLGANQNSSISVTAAGNYTVTVSDATGCTATRSIAVAQNASPTITNITQNNPLCDNAITLTAQSNGTSYLWSNGGTTNTLLVGTPNIYTVTVTGTGNCTATATYRLAQATVAVTPNITQTAPLCVQNSSAILDAGAAYSSWVWSTNANTQTITTPTAGVYTVTVTNTAGCTRSSTFAVVLEQNPVVPVITPSGTTICGNGSITLNAANPLYNNYEWSLGASQNSSIVVNTAGNYTVTVSNLAGCTASTSIPVTQNAVPAKPVLTQNAPWCPNANGSVSVVAPVAGAIYTWSNMTAGTTTTAFASGQLTVTVTQNGCTNTETINIANNTLPALPNILQRDSLCANNNGRLFAGQGYASYLWNTTQTQPQINITAAGTYTVTVTNLEGCSITNTIVVAQQAAVAPPTFAQAANLCSNRPTTLTANGAYTAWAWANIAGANTNTIQITTNTPYTVTVTAANRCTISTSYTPILYTAPTPPTILISNSLCATVSGTIAVPNTFSSYAWSGGVATANAYQQTVTSAGVYTITVTDNNTCTNSNSIDIAQAATPATPTITYKSVFCAGELVDIVAAAGYETYTWGGTNNTNTLTISTAGTYTVTVTNVAGCTAIGAFTAAPNTPPAAPTIDIATALCIDKTTELTAIGGFASYLWSDGTSGQATTINAGGVYSVTITDAIGCKNNSSVTITVENPTLVNITGGTYYCEGGSINLQTNAAFTTYEWSTTADTRGINVASAGSYSVTATAANGCTGTATIFINEQPLPDANAGSDQTIYFGQTAQLTATGGTAYLWQTANSLSNLTTNNPIANPLGTTTYTVLITDSFGCSKNDDMDVIVLDYPDCLKTNEGVSPNGDGKNDTWQVPCLQYFPNTLQIINRWGQTIYTATNYNNDFDGTSEGKEQPDGTYYYIVQFSVNGITKTLKGTLTIIR
jgi:gliding motility-associated-like protein